MAGSIPPGSAKQTNMKKYNHNALGNRANSHTRTAEALLESVINIGSITYSQFPKEDRKAMEKAYDEIENSVLEYIRITEKIRDKHYNIHDNA